MPTSLDGAARVAVRKVKAAALKAQRDLPTRNGISIPKEGSICWKAWLLFEQLPEEATVKDAAAHAKRKKINEATVRTQYYRWRKFNADRNGIRANHG